MSSNFPTFDSKKIVKALSKKGFEPNDEKEHHNYFSFAYKGEVTEIKHIFLMI